MFQMPIMTTLDLLSALHPDNKFLICYIFKIQMYLLFSTLLVFFSNNGFVGGGWAIVGLLVTHVLSMTYLGRDEAIPCLLLSLLWCQLSEILATVIFFCHTALQSASLHAIPFLKLRELSDYDHLRTVTKSTWSYLILLLLSSSYHFEQEGDSTHFLMFHFVPIFFPYSAHNKMILLARYSRARRLASWSLPPKPKPRRLCR